MNGSRNSCNIIFQNEGDEESILGFVYVKIWESPHLKKFGFEELYDEHALLNEAFLFLDEMNFASLLALGPASRTIAH